MTDRPFSLQDLEPGDHLCCIYETEQEHRAVLTPFLTDGLHTGEKVLYIVDAHTAETVMKYLRDEGADADRYVAKGQFSILTSDAAYMQTGVFDPQGMISLLQAETEAALAEGYSALRVTGEMTWALRGLPGSERLIEYETLLNDFLPSSRCLAICQYDARRFTPDVLLNVLRTHPIAVVGTAIYDNFYYVSPAELLSDSQPTAELRHWIRNLAERRQGDEALRESEERYRQVFQQSPVGIGISSPDGGIIMASKAMQDITGYSADELLEINLADTYENRQDRTALLEAISRDGSVRDYPVRLKRKDGTPYDAQLSIESIRLGGRDFYHTICQDVTERKRAETQLGQRTEDLQLINALNDAVNRGADLQTVIELMSSELKRTLPCNGATLYLLSDDQEYLVIQNLALRPSTAARIEALIGGTIPEVRIRLKEGSLYRRILEDCDAQIINDAKTIKRMMAECTENRLLKKLVGKLYSFLDIHSVISVPLMEDGKAIGLLDVSRSEPFSEADANRLKSIAPQLIGCLQRKRLEDARRDSEERYRLLFDSSPICLWEEDFSDVKRYLENLRSSGVNDFRAYFGQHPEAVRECTSLVKIADVNRSALDFYQAETKAELLRGLEDRKSVV